MVSYPLREDFQIFNFLPKCTFCRVRENLWLARQLTCFGIFHLSLYTEMSISLFFLHVFILILLNQCKFFLFLKNKSYLCKVLT